MAAGPVQDHHKNGIIIIIRVRRVLSQDNPADTFTKKVPVSALQRHPAASGLQELRVGERDISTFHIKTSTKGFPHLLRAHLL